MNEQDFWQRSFLTFVGRSEDIKTSGRLADMAIQEYRARYHPEEEDEEE